ncbi:MAG: cytochrome C oxidase subunit IV family protein [Deltaproteobacteria bacterium]|nr:MAG: cytochrome C oxidase subunit IV family protein [Deltaproteobacteria bacterium]
MSPETASSQIARGATEGSREAPHHPNYVLIWGILVAALAVSLFIGYMSLPVVTVVLIFTVAVVKAYLVLSYYMHLRYEPFFVALIVAAGLACLYFLFFGLVPDIVYPPSP